MKREFLLNIILLLVINGLIKPFYLFGIDAKIQFLVGQEAYGLFFTLFNFSYLFQLFNDPGIQNYTSHKVASDEGFVASHLGRLLGSKLLFGLLFLGMVMIGGLVMGYPKHYFWILFLVTINHFLAAFFIYFRSCIAALGHYRIDSLISGLDKLIMVGLLGYLLYGGGLAGDFKINYLIYGQMIAYVIACAVAGGLLLRVAPPVQIRLSLDYIRSLLRQSLPFALVLLLMSLYNRLDGVMLERLLLDNGFQAGVYASCYRFMEALNMVGYLFAALLLPMYARLIGSDGLGELSQVALRMIIVIALACAVSIIVFRQEVLLWRYPYADELYFDALSWLMVSFVAVTTAYIYGTLQVANGTLRGLNTVFALGAVINIGLNLLLIPELLALGAAIATAVTQVFVMVGQIFLGHKRFQIPYNIGLILRIIIWTGLVVGIASFLQKMEGPWWIRLLASISISGLSALIVGVINKDMLFSLLAKRTNLND